MRIHSILVFLFCLCFAANSKAQLYLQLEKADSLSIASEYNASIDLINAVLNANPRNFLRSQAYYQLSYNFLQLYDLDKSYEYNRKSLDIRDRLHYEFIAGNYMRFGTIEMLKGNHQAALDYFQEAKDLPHESLQFSGILDGYLGTIYERLGKADLALEFYNNSLEILRWELDENHPDISVAYYNLGNYFAAQNNNNKALENYEKSIVIELKTAWGADGNPRLAKAYNAYGLLTYEQETDLVEAKKLFEGALLASKGFERLTAASLINLAQVDFLNRDFQGVKEKLNKAAAELDHSTEDEEPQYFVPLILDKKLYANLLQIRTQVYLEEYFESKDINDLKNAYESSTLALDVFEGQLLDFYNDKSQLELLDNSKDIYETAVYVASKLHEIKGEKKYLEAALKFAERGKAIVLKNQMQQFFGMLEADLPEDLKTKEKLLRNELTYFETSLAVKHEADNFRKATLRLHREYKDLLKSIEKSAPQYYDLRYQVSNVSISSIQRKLASDEVLISYYQGAQLYYVFAIGKKETQMYYAYQDAPLETESKIDFKKIKDKASGGFPMPTQTTKSPDIPKLPKPDPGIYTQYTEMDLKAGVDKGLTGMIKLSKGQFIAANHSLYRRLIEPIKPILKKKKKLVIIPHGDLHYVTFETLLKEKPKKKKIKYHKLKYLIKDYSVSYEMSADFFVENVITKSPTINSIAAFAPVFNPADKIGYTLEAEQMVFDSSNWVGMKDSRSMMPDRNSFAMLKYSEDEVIAILELFASKKGEGKAFIRNDATEDQFKKEAANYNHLHLASHSFVNTLKPNLSGVALSPSKNEDGILFAGEVMNLDLRNTDLVVLSSCESGVGELIRGEGLLSLNRAFRFAGVRHSISTRWKISDKASAKLMVYFYQKLLSGASYAEALRFAKLKMIKKSNTAIPKLWAGFTLTGR